MKDTIKEIKNSFKARTLWTLWGLLLCPFVYLFLFLTALMISIMHLDVEVGVDFFKDAL